jgi:hypothetical protein
MGQIYIEKWSETIVSGHSKYVFSDRVQVGHILHVQSCYAYDADLAQNDIIKIGVRNGGVDVLARAHVKTAKDVGMSALNTFFVGEGDLVFAHFPQALNTNTIELHVIGELFRLEEWRKRQEG